MTTSLQDEQHHALYRFYSDSGHLLYVGITSNPGARFPQHQKDKPWWHEVSGISVEKYPSRQSALDAEVRAIDVESPKYNKVRPQLRSRRRATKVRPTLVWLCRSCGEAIENGRGYIHVNMLAIREVEAKTREIKDRVRARNSGSPFELWNGGDLMDLPSPVRWMAHHASCDPDPESDDYHFDVARARTHSHLLDWTAHLMGKRWISATNWSDFIRTAAGVDA